MNLAIFDSWRVFGSLKGHWHLARFPLGECSTWHDISTWQGDIYLVHLAEVGGVRQMLLCAKCNVAKTYYRVSLMIFRYFTEIYNDIWS